MKFTRLVAMSVLLWLQDGCFAQGNSIPPTQIGVAHVSGKYHFTSKHYLDEGADEIQRLGAKCIKVYLALDTEMPSSKCYKFGSEWPQCRTLAELAASPPFRRLFARRFETFVLTTFRSGRTAGYWRREFTERDARDEERELYELARYLSRKYRSSGKTFILQNWEGDWAVRGNFDPKTDPKSDEFQRMTAWLQARQHGVERARHDEPARGVRVLHAAEVCLVRDGMERGRPCVANRVVPNVAPDLVSYSCWETQDAPELLRRALDWLASQTPDRPPFGERNVYIGEFGCPENEFPTDKQRAVVTSVLKTARDFGCPYAIYWAVHCNEARREPVKSNQDVRGFCLVRPDGSHTLSWDLLAKAIRDRARDETVH